MPEVVYWLWAVIESERQRKLGTELCKRSMKEEKDEATQERGKVKHLHIPVYVQRVVTVENEIAGRWPFPT